MANKKSFDFAQDKKSIRLAQDKKPQVIAVVGGQWGDEGKGKIVDYLAQEADVVIRAQGGDNAGHTVVNEHGKFGLALLPAGIFNPKTLNIIGAGVALNLASLIEEIEALEAQGIPIKNLIVSPKAHLTFKYHQTLDGLEEAARGKNKIGTTGHGIGPTYMDKAARIGLRVEQLKNPKKLLANLEPILRAKAKLIGIKRHLFELEPQSRRPELKVEYYSDLIKKAYKMIQPLVKNTEEVVFEHLNKGSTIVIEGAHGVLLDLDHGTYPKVTSSNPIVSGLLTGSGIPARYLTRSIGVFKAYQTRVGEGGMPTEMEEQKAQNLRNKGHEYGTRTGRPRRIGYFDGVAARYSDILNGFSDIAITRVDTLTNFGDLKIAKNYLLNGKKMKFFPTDEEDLLQAKADYNKDDHYPGWTEDLSTIKSFHALPKNVQKYCQGIMENFHAAKLSFVGVGPERDALIVV